MKELYVHSWSQLNVTQDYSQLAVKASVDRFDLAVFQYTIHSESKSTLYLFYLPKFNRLCSLSAPSHIMSYKLRLLSKKMKSIQHKHKSKLNEESEDLHHEDLHHDGNQINQRNMNLNPINVKISIIT
jgi:hypothetical protein